LEGIVQKDQENLMISTINPMEQFLEEHPSEDMALGKSGKIAQNR